MPDSQARSENSSHPENANQLNAEFTAKVAAWGKDMGFDAIGISNTDLSAAEQRLYAWLAQDYQGDMAWMHSHGTKRSRPAELVPGTLSIISVRMNYLPEPAADAEMVLNHPELGYISRYALGRDYHKVLRQRLKKLAQRMQQEIGEFGYRVFTDSAPVLEKPIAVKAGLGWLGKHTNVLSRDAGSWFFLGELYTDLPLQESGAQGEHCGACTACIDVCPTQAIVAPYELDARRCISYLTIEHKGCIPVELRPLMGNRIYGCDDCQLICPWNRFARHSPETDFNVRHQLDAQRLLDLFHWDEATFLQNFTGSAIRRIGFVRWQRNLAVAIGNAPPNKNLLTQLKKQLGRTDNEMVREHIIWAIDQQEQRLNGQ